MALKRVGKGIQMTGKEYKEYKHLQFDALLTAATLIMIAAEAFPQEIKEKVDKIFLQVNEVYEEAKEWWTE